MSIVSYIINELKREEFWDKRERQEEESAFFHPTTKCDLSKFLVSMDDPLEISVYDCVQKEVGHLDYSIEGNELVGYKLRIDSIKINKEYSLEIFKTLDDSLKLALNSYNCIVTGRKNCTKKEKYIREANGLVAYLESNGYKKPVSQLVIDVGTRKFELLNYLENSGYVTTSESENLTSMEYDLFNQD